MDADSFNANGLAWAVSRWNDEVKHRPLVNVHRRTLDDTWRQVIRYFGGDPDKLIGPSHDTLHMQAQEERAWKPPVHGVKGTYAAEAAVDVLREQGVVDGVMASVGSKPLTVNFEFESLTPLEGMDRIYAEYAKTFGRYPDAFMAQVVGQTKEDLFIWWGAHREKIRVALVAAGMTEALPRSDSEEAADGIEVVMAERNYPCAPKNAARVGWEAAFRWLRTHGVKASGLPAWVDGLRDFMERNGKTTEEIGNMLVAAGFATRGVTPSQAPGLAWMVPAMREMAKGLPNSKADALLKWADAIERATRGVGVAPVSEWAEAERIRDLPDVDEAIRNMLEDQTGDNSTCMVRAVLAAAGVAIPLKDQK